MATVTFNIPNPFAVRLNDAIAHKYGYDPAIHGTKTEFSKACITTILRKIVLEYESGIAAGSARSAVETDVNGVSIT